MATYYDGDDDDDDDDEDDDDDDDADGDDDCDYSWEFIDITIVLFLQRIKLTTIFTWVAVESVHFQFNPPRPVGST